MGKRTCGLLFSVAALVLLAVALAVPWYTYIQKANCWIDGTCRYGDWSFDFHIPDALGNIYKITMVLTIISLVLTCILVFFMCFKYHRGHHHGGMRSRVGVAVLACLFAAAAFITFAAGVAYEQNNENINGIDSKSFWNGDYAQPHAGWYCTVAAFFCLAIGVYWIH